MRTPGNKSYHTTGVFLIAAVLLLPLELLVLVALVQHVPEWLRSRDTWYIQTFNILDHTLAMMARVGGCARRDERSGLDPNDGRPLRAAGVAASVVFVALNHGADRADDPLGAAATRCARSFSFQTPLDRARVRRCSASSLAAFWTANPWLVPFAIAPLLLIHRALSVPQLQAEARVDPKTGLFNARHFAAALTEELGRAQRFQRPMSLIMADLDLLREINNTYGHLAGDAVLKGIAEVFREQLRHYDVPARFGGEEFAILLPETEPEQALEIAERIRRAVAERAVRGRDVERADPRDRLDRRRRLPTDGRGRERADPPGRPRRLPGEAPGPQPRPRRELASRCWCPRSAARRSSPSPRTATTACRCRAFRRPRPRAERRHTQHTVHGPRFLQLSRPAGGLVGAVIALGVIAGALGLVFGTSTDVIGLLAIIALVGVGQALALEVDDGSISVSAVGALAGAALFGPRAALALAVTTAVVEWSARRTPDPHASSSTSAR